MNTTDRDMKEQGIKERSLEQTITCYCTTVINGGKIKNQNEGTILCEKGHGDVNMLSCLSRVSVGSAGT